jgi:hypothetical protein
VHERQAADDHDMPLANQTLIRKVPMFGCSFNPCIFVDAVK